MLIGKVSSSIMSYRSTLLQLPATLREMIATRLNGRSTAYRMHPATLSRAANQIQPTMPRAYSATPSEATRPPVSHQQYKSSDPTDHGSVSADEVAHFNKLASSWWDPEGSSRLLHLMNPVRHRFIQQCLHQTSQALSTNGLRYLDIGCGGGIFAESAARLSSTASVTAIDPTPEVLRIARQHQRQDPLLLEPGRLTYLNTALEDLDIPSSQNSAYDVVSLFEVVEHIQNPAPFLQAALGHVKPGGWLVGSTIARTALSWVTTKLIAEDIIRLVPRGTHDWSQYIQPDELRAWARKQPQIDQAYDKIMGVVYVPAIGWREIQGSERLGNYFFAFRRFS